MKRFEETDEYLGLIGKTIYCTDDTFKILSSRIEYHKGAAGVFPRRSLCLLKKLDTRHYCPNAANSI